MSLYRISSSVVSRNSLHAFANLQWMGNGHAASAPDSGGRFLFRQLRRRIEFFARCFSRHGLMIKGIKITGTQGPGGRGIRTLERAHLRAAGAAASVRARTPRE